MAIATRATERVRHRRAQRKASGRTTEAKIKESHEPWSQRILAHGSAPLVFAAAMAINVPARPI